MASPLQRPQLRGVGVAAALRGRWLVDAAPWRQRGADLALPMDAYGGAQTTNAKLIRAANERGRKQTNEGRRKMTKLVQCL